ADDSLGGGPVGLLDALLEEDRAGELADDIAARLELVDHLGLEIDGVFASRHRGQQAPVLLRDLHHVIDARVITVAAFGQAEVGAFAAVAGNDVADDDGAIVAGVPDHRDVLVLGSEGGSISVLIRSKLPSMVGVKSYARMPPARFMGPVCTAVTPISRKRRQSSGSPKLRSTDSPGRVI